MKKVIFIAIFAALTMPVMAQTFDFKTISKVDISDLFYFFYFQPGNAYTFRTDSLGDTVFIENVPNLKFIKIDGVVYQVKRTTTLEKAELTQPHSLSWGDIINSPLIFNDSDTAAHYFYKPFNNQYIPLTGN